MEQITFENMGERLIETVPELRSTYETEADWWGDEKPGPHIVFGDVFNPYLISLLKSCVNHEKLRQIFAFLEMLANHEDVRIQEVVAVTVCERLGANKECLTKARKYMGPTTLRFSKEIEHFWAGKGKQCAE